MGLEKTCEVQVARRRGTAKVHLEPTEIRIGGDFALAIPLASLSGYEAKAGLLRLAWPKGTATLALGADALKWAQKIRYPRSRLDKLGVKPDMRIALVGLSDRELLRELRERTKDVSTGKPKPETDLVIVAMSARADLEELRSLRLAIKKNGAIWVVWPKGRKEFREDDVRAHGPKAGLVDVKVMSFSDTLSGLKMVIPVKER
jgi:hypothetical protein